MAERLVPSYATAHLMVAEALLMLGRTREVQAEAERAVQLGS